MASVRQSLRPALAGRLKAMGQPSTVTMATHGPQARDSRSLFIATAHHPAPVARPRLVFVDSMSDLWHDAIDANPIARVLAVALMGLLEGDLS